MSIGIDSVPRDKNHSDKKLGEERWGEGLHDVYVGSATVQFFFSQAFWLGKGKQIVYILYPYTL